jgi:hypothetical protein
MQHLAPKMRIQMLQTHTVALGCSGFKHGQVFANEFVVRIFERAPRLVTPRNGFDFAEPIPKTLFSNCSVCCL